MTGIGSTKSKPISLSSGEAEQVHVAFGLPVAFWSASFMLNCVDLLPLGLHQHLCSPVREGKE